MGTLKLIELIISKYIKINNRLKYQLLCLYVFYFYILIPFVITLHVILSWFNIVIVYSKAVPARSITWLRAIVLPRKRRTGRRIIDCHFTQIHWIYLTNSRPGDYRYILLDNLDNDVITRHTALLICKTINVVVKCSR